MVPQKNNRTTLFDLVQRLTTTECRTFSKGQQSTNGAEESLAYLQLFQLVRGASKPDDEKWRTQLSLDKDGYRQLKKYLTDKLVNSLASQQEISPRVEITRLISHAEVFYLRGLLSQAQVALHQADEVASTYEFIEERIAIQEWLMKVHLHNGDLEAADQALRLGQTVIQQLAQLKELQGLHLQFQLIERTILASSSSLVSDTHTSLEAIKNLLHSPMLTKGDSMLTIRAKIVQSAIMSIGLRLQGQFEQSLVWLQQLMDTLQQNQEVRLSNPNLVIDSYRNLGLTYLALGQGQQLDTLLGQLRQQRFLSQGQNQKLQLLVGRLSISQHLSQGAYHIAADEGANLETQLKDFHLDPAFGTDVAYTIAQAYVMAGKNSDAIKMLAYLINGNNIYGKLPEYEYSVRLMELAVHADLGDESFVASKLRSVQHFLKTSGLMTSGDQLDHGFFLKLARAGTAAERQSIKSAFVQRQISNTSNAIGGSFGYQFDLVGWVERLG